MKKRIFIIIAIIIIGLIAMIFIAPSKTEYEYTSEIQNLKAPIDIPDSRILKYSNDIPSDEPMVALFYVDWCTYCRRFMPIFGELAKKYEGKYYFTVINCEYPENISLVKKFHIIGYPSLFIIDKKINHSFMLNIAWSSDKSLINEELDAYLKVRRQIVK